MAGALSAYIGGECVIVSFGRIRTALLVFVAALVVVVPSGVADARVRQTAPARVSSPYRYFDASNDCLSGSGLDSGPNCDVLKVKLVNGPEDLVITTVVRGNPQEDVSYQVELEGMVDYRLDVWPTGAQVSEAFVGNPDTTCSTGFGTLGAAKFGDHRMTIHVPRSCIPGLRTLRARALATEISQSGADYAPEEGDRWTPRIRMSS